MIRNVLRILAPAGGSLRSLTDRYQVYGNVCLNIDDVSFNIYSEADDLIASELYYGSDYETSEFKLVKALTQNASLFADVGANTGLFSLFAAKANPNLKVISYEPHPSNYSRLQKNISINNTNNISARELAVGDSESTIGFTIPADGRISATSSANHGFSKNFHAVAHKEISVKQTTLTNELSGRITSRDLLKIDVEYYELNVLKGAEDVIRQSRPFVMIEVLEYERLVEQFPSMKGLIDADHARRIQDFFRALDYHPYALHPTGILNVSSVSDPHPSRNFLFIGGPPVTGMIPFDKLTSPEKI
ncbi:MAG: FkbM family methyltransferase [Bacteroidota bacterium]